MLTASDFMNNSVEQDKDNNMELASLFSSSISTINNNSNQLIQNSSIMCKLNMQFSYFLY